MNDLGRRVVSDYYLLQRRTLLPQSLAQKRGQRRRGMTKNRPIPKAFIRQCTWLIKFFFQLPFPLSEKNNLGTIRAFVPRIEFEMPYIFRNNISTVQKANCHVLSIPGITPNHLTVGLKTSFSDFVDRNALVISLAGRHDRMVGGQRKVNPWVRN